MTPTSRARPESRSCAGACRRRPTRSSPCDRRRRSRRNALRRRRLAPRSWPYACRDRWRALDGRKGPSRPSLPAPARGPARSPGRPAPKGGGYCAAMSPNLGHFAASNWAFFVSSSSLSFSTWCVQSPPTPSEIALNNGSTAPLAISSHTPFVLGATGLGRGVANRLEALSGGLQARPNRRQAARDCRRRQAPS